MSILSTNLKLDLKKPKEKNVQIAIDGQDERARAKWERLTGFMLNIDDVQRGHGIGASLTNLLVHADFVQPVPAASQSHTNSSTPFELTADGFRFVLLDTPTQVHTMLRKYIERTVHDSGRAGGAFSGLTVELIKLIFNLALSEFDQVYKLRNPSEQGGLKKAVKRDFEQMGLVEFIDEENDDKFFITKLMQSFLLTQVGNLHN